MKSSTGRDFQRLPVGHARIASWGRREQTDEDVVLKTSELGYCDQSYGRQIEIDGFGSSRSSVCVCAAAIMSG